MGRRVVDRESIPDFPADVFAEQIRQRLTAMDIQIVQNQMDRICFRICHRQVKDNLGELNGGSIRRWEREVTACLWLYRAEDVGRSASFVFAVASRFPAGRRCGRGSYLGVQCYRLLIQADYGSSGL